MKRVTYLLAVLIALCGFGSAQTSSERLTSGSLTALAAACGTGTSTGYVAVALPVNVGAVTAQVSGTYSATIQFQVSNDGGVNFVNVVGQPIPTGVPVSTITGTGVYQFNTSGFTNFCVRASAYTSGTAVVNLSFSPSPTVAGFVQVDSKGLLTHGATGGISCVVTVSTATTVQAVGNSCVAPGAGLSIYVTDIQVSASASGIAADAFPTIKYGTGGTCGTGTGIAFGVLSASAIVGFQANFSTPIKIPANNELCWIASTAGSKFLVINGFIAP